MSFYATRWSKMVHKCVVRGCKSEWHPQCNTSFHIFPKDVARRNKWLSIVPLKTQFYEKAKICGLHFKRTDFKDKRLTRSANPFYVETTDVTDVQENTRKITPTVDLPMRYLIIDATTSISESSAVAVKCEPDYDKSDNDDEEPPDIQRKLIRSEISLPFRNGCFMSVTSLPSSGTSSDAPISVTEVKQVTAELPPIKNNTPSKTRTFSDSCVQARLKTEREKKLWKKNKVLIQKLKRQEKSINHMKALLSVVKNYTAHSEIENIIKGNFAEICKLFNKPDTSRNVRYCDEVKAFALNLHFYSPKAYDFLRKHISLPHPETLRRASHPTEPISVPVTNLIGVQPTQEI